MSFVIQFLVCIHCQISSGKDRTEVFVEFFIKSCISGRYGYLMCFLLPVDPVQNISEPFNTFFGIFFGVMFIIYLYLIIYCGIKLTMIRKKYLN